MQPTFSSWNEALVTAWQNILVNLFYFVPNIIAAAALFLVGLLLARWAKKLTVKLLSALKLNALLEKTGAQKFLAKAEVKPKIEEIVGGIIKWIILAVFFVAAVNVLGLTTVSRVLDAILAYIPRAFSAVLIMAIGVLLAGVVESLIKGALFHVDLKAARLLAKIGAYLVVIFAILTAVNELGIAQALIGTLFTGFVAMLALGFGLAIGLGSKDLVARVLDEWYGNLKKDLKKK